MGSTVRVGSRSWHEAIARLFAALDDPDLLERLVNTIQEAIHVDNAIASAYCRDGRPIIFYNDWSAPEHSVNRFAVPRWVESAYLLDPFYRAFLAGIDSGLYTLKELAADHFRRTEYYEQFYADLLMTDEAAFLIRVDDDSMLEISLNRIRPYSKREITCLREIEPVVLEVGERCIKRADFAAKISEQRPPAVHDRLETAVEKFGAGTLTTRECEIVRLLLRGHSVKSTAELLKLSPGTVKIHRRNIYEKLEISSQSQLFSRFFDFLSPEDG